MFRCLVLLASLSLCMGQQLRAARPVMVGMQVRESILNLMKEEPPQAPPAEHPATPPPEHPAAEPNHPAETPAPHPETPAGPEHNATAPADHADAHPGDHTPPADAPQHPTNATTTPAHDPKAPDAAAHPNVTAPHVPDVAANATAPHVPDIPANATHHPNVTVPAVNGSHPDVPVTLPPLPEVANCKENFPVAEGPAKGSVVNFEAWKDQPFFKREVAALAPCLVADPNNCAAETEWVSHLSGALGSTAQIIYQVEKGQPAYPLDPTTKNEFKSPEEVATFLNALKTSEAAKQTIRDHSPCIDGQPGGIDGFLNGMDAAVKRWLQ